MFTKALGFLLLALPAAAAEIVETAEGPGFSYAWSEPWIATPGNAMNPDFLTAQAPGLFPESWQDEALGIAVNVPGGVLLREQIAPVTELDVSLDFMVVRNEMRVNTGATLVVAKETHGGHESDIAAWVVYLYQRPEGLELLVLLGRYSPEPMMVRIPVELWRSYTLTLGYGEHYLVEVDGVIAVEGSVSPLWASQVEWLVIGASGSSDGEGLIYFVDNYMAIGR